MTKIIAKRTDKQWGYRKGDVLTVVERRFNGYVAARNLTCPGRFERRVTILAPHEYRDVTDDETFTTTLSASALWATVLTASIVGSFIGTIVGQALGA